MNSNNSKTDDPRPSAHSLPSTSQTVSIVPSASEPVPVKKKGGAKHCCYGLCRSDSRYLPDDTEIRFIPFFKPGKIKEGMSAAQIELETGFTEKCQRWVNACCREDFSVAKVTRSTYICTLHFIGGKGPTLEHPDPIKATASAADVGRFTRKRKPPKKREPVSKKVKSIAASVSTSTDNPVMEPTIMPHPVEEVEGEENTDFETDFEIDSPYLNAKCESGKKVDDKETQTEYTSHELKLKIENTVLKNQIITQLDNKQENPPVNEPPTEVLGYGNIGIDKVLVSTAKCLHFTGLNPNQFWMLYNWLGDSKNNLQYWSSGKSTMTAVRKFSLSEELYLTLLRLRRGFTLQTIAYMFNVSEASVRNIFTTWIMLLFCHFKDFKVAMFPKRASLKKYLPSVFRKFKNIRASVDCTEFFCQMPRNYAQQGNLYSSYKHHTTFKCLIAVNPNGAASFVSDLYEGAVSDVDLFETCGILDHIDPGDALLVDKGFTVQSSLLPKQATIFIPPFLGQRDSFTKEEVILTKRIAKARIHVERFNERLKKFMLINGTIPLSLAPIASQLVFVCSCLVNFQKCLSY